jgi:hypothetical protein
MSKTGRPNHRRGPRGTRKAERYITVRSVRREPPDLRKLSRAVIAMALREAESDEEAQIAMKSTTPLKRNSGKESAEADEEADHE